MIFASARGPAASLFEADTDFPPIVCPQVTPRAAPSPRRAASHPAVRFRTRIGQVLDKYRQIQIIKMDGGNVDIRQLEPRRLRPHQLEPTAAPLSPTIATDDRALDCNDLNSQLSSQVLQLGRTSAFWIKNLHWPPSPLSPTIATDDQFGSVNGLPLKYTGSVFKPCYFNSTTDRFFPPESCTATPSFGGGGLI